MRNDFGLGFYVTLDYANSVGLSGPLMGALLGYGMYS